MVKMAFAIYQPGKTMPLVHSMTLPYLAGTGRHLILKLPRCLSAIHISAAFKAMIEKPSGRCMYAAAVRDLFCGGRVPYSSGPRILHLLHVRKSL